MFQSKGLNMGQIEALVRILGGAKEVEKILGNSVINITVVLGDRRIIALEGGCISFEALLREVMVHEWDFTEPKYPREATVVPSKIMEFRFVNDGPAELQNHDELAELIVKNGYQLFPNKDAAYATVAGLLTAGEILIKDKGHNFFPFESGREGRREVLMLFGGRLMRASRTFVPSAGEYEGTNRLFVVSSEKNGEES